MPLLGKKRKAALDSIPHKHPKTKRSRLFFRRSKFRGPPSPSPSNFTQTDSPVTDGGQDPSSDITASPFTRPASVRSGRSYCSVLHKLRYRTSKLFRFSRGAPLWLYPQRTSDLSLAGNSRSNMDGASVPAHRNARPTTPAMTRSRKLRSFLSRSTSLETPSASQRKRSVRFEGFSDSPQIHQLDGHFSEDNAESGQPASVNSQASQKPSVSERIANLESKFTGNPGIDTIVHRANLRPRLSLPFIDTSVGPFSTNELQGYHASPASSNSSSTPFSRNLAWSPAGTASTAATSITSPGSSGSRYNRTTPDDGQNISKSNSGGAQDHTLPAIEEHSGRLLLIPVQEATVEGQPTVATVENVTAAKAYLETFFNDLWLEPSSPRSLRRKTLEQKMSDLGLTHDERLEARKSWFRAESDHLRQVRVLKASSLLRHSLKGVSIAGFDVIRVLGKGSFGIVRLVTERSVDGPRHGHNDEGEDSPASTDTACVSNMDGTARRNIPTGKPLADVFAMKVIRKSEMLRACQEGHLRAERDFLVGAEGSRWVVPLIASFQDNTNLYLVMEYMIGGDFLGLLLREDVLEEDVAK